VDAERGIGFEDIVFHIERGDLLDVLEHPHPDHYAGQRILYLGRIDYTVISQHSSPASWRILSAESGLRFQHLKRRSPTPAR